MRIEGGLRESKGSDPVHRVEFNVRMRFPDDAAPDVLNAAPEKSFAAAETPSRPPARRIESRPAARAGACSSGCSRRRPTPSGRKPGWPANWRTCSPRTTSISTIRREAASCASFSPTPTRTRLKTFASSSRRAAGTATSPAHPVRRHDGVNAHGFSSSSTVRNAGFFARLETVEDFQRGWGPCSLLKTFQVSGYWELRLGFAYLQ